MGLSIEGNICYSINFNASYAKTVMINQNIYLKFENDITVNWVIFGKSNRIKSSTLKLSIANLCMIQVLPIDQYSTSSFFISLICITLDLWLETNDSSKQSEIFERIFDEGNSWHWPIEKHFIRFYTPDDSTTYM